MSRWFSDATQQEEPLEPQHSGRAAVTPVGSCENNGKPASGHVTTVGFTPRTPAGGGGAASSGAAAADCRSTSARTVGGAQPGAWPRWRLRLGRARRARQSKQATQRKQGDAFDSTIIADRTERVRVASPGFAPGLAHSEQFCSQVHCQRERGPAVPTAEPARTDHFKAVQNTEVTAWSGSSPDRGVADERRSDSVAESEHAAKHNSTLRREHAGLCVAATVQLAVRRPRLPPIQ